MELRERDMIGGVYAVLIGDKDPSTGLYSNYFRAGCHPSACPDVAIDSVEYKLREHLDREGLGLPYKEENTVKNIVTTVTANQGGFLQGDPKDAIPALVAAIMNTREVVRSASASEQKTLVPSIGMHQQIVELKDQITNNERELAALRRLLEEARRRGVYEMDMI